VDLGGSGPDPGELRLAFGRVAADDTAAGTKAGVAVVFGIEVDGKPSGGGCSRGRNAGGVVVSNSWGVGVLAVRSSGDGSTCDRRSAAVDGAATRAVNQHATRGLGDGEESSDLEILSSCHLENGEMRLTSEPLNGFVLSLSFPLSSFSLSLLLSVSFCWRSEQDQQSCMSRRLAVFPTTIDELDSRPRPCGSSACSWRSRQQSSGK